MLNLATRSNRSFKLALGVIAIVGVSSIAGCDGASIGRPAPHFTIDYVIRTVPDPAAMIADVVGGTTSVGQLVGPSRCEFEADFNVTNDPDIDRSGTPGQIGANVSIQAINPLPRSAPTSECRQMSNISILIGDLNTTLNLGVPVNVTSASLVANGPGLPTDAAFSSSNGFFSGELSSFNASTRYFSGEFEFIAPGPNGFVFIATGKYGK